MTIEISTPAGSAHAPAPAQLVTAGTVDRTIPYWDDTAKKWVEATNLKWLGTDVLEVTGAVDISGGLDALGGAFSVNPDANGAFVEIKDGSGTDIITYRLCNSAANEGSQFGYDLGNNRTFIANFQGTQQLQIDRDSGDVVITSTSASTDSSTGALVVNGGVGVGGDVTIDGKLHVGMGLTPLASTLEVVGALEDAITGTVDTVASNPLIGGVGTAFLTELVPGQHILVSGEILVVSSISSNTILFVEVAPTQTLFGVTVFVSSNILNVSNGDNAHFNINKNGALSIGTDTPSASALVQIDATNRGFLGPRMTTTQRDAIAGPVQGLEIYNTTTNEPEFYNGAAWITTGGTAPAGANNSVQYNNNGAFGGMSQVVSDGSDMTFNDGGTLSLGTSDDLNMFHNGTLTTFINGTSGGLFTIQQTAAASLLLHNSHISNDIIAKLGTSDIDTAFSVHNNNDLQLLRVMGSGAVAVGVATPAVSSILDLTSTSLGFLPPRMTTTERDNIVSAVAGLLIYNATSLQLEAYDGTTWGVPHPGESLAIALGIGNETGGNNIVLSNGDSIASATNAVGEPINLTAGNGTAGAGGVVDITTGDGTASGGNMLVQLGDASAGPGGSFSLSAGDGTTGGGTIGISAGNALNGDVMGSAVTITGGDARDEFGGDEDGGNVILQGGGIDGGGGQIGKIVMQLGGGFVGIGTSDPDGPLNVFQNNSSTSITAGIRISQHGSGDAVLHFDHTGNEQYSIGFDHSVLQFRISAAADLNDNPRLIIDDSTGFVGIGGSAAPDAQLHVQESSAGAVTADTNSVLVVESGDAISAISMLGTDSSTLQLLFGLESNNRDGGIFYNVGDAQGMDFHVNGDQLAMSIDANLDVTIGDIVTVPDARLHVVDGSAGGVEAVAGTVLCVENSDDAFISLLTPDANISGILFGHESDPDALRLIANEGNLGIGTDNPEALVEIEQGSSNASIFPEIPTVGDWEIQTSAADNDWDDIAFGNDTFVAISTNGTDRVMTSTDGISWTNISTPLDGDSLAGIAFGGGTFVVVAFGSNNFMTSTDNGATWTQRNSPSSNQWTAVAYSETTQRFVTVNASGADPKACYSDDFGVTWTLSADAGSGGLPNFLWNDITWGDFSGGRFVAVSNDGGQRAYFSADGDTWTQSSTPPDAAPVSVAFGNGIYIAVDDGGDLSQRVTRSIDGGVTWANVPAANTNAWKSVAFGNGHFMAVSISGSGDRAMTSTDGLVWTALPTPVDNNWNGVTFGRGTFVAVALTGTGDRAMVMPLIKTSVMELVENDPEVLGDWASQTSAADEIWLSVAFGNGVYVAVTFSEVMTSPDGETWTTQSPQGGNWFDVTFGNGLFVAISNTGHPNQVQTSPDGVTWTLRTTPQSRSWHSVTFGGGTFVAVALSSPNVMTSPDGITWTIKAIGADRDWIAIAFGNDTFVIVDDNGFPAPNSAISTDNGETWSTAGEDLPNLDFTGIAFGKGLFVAVASNGGVGSIETSPDGISWTTRTTPGTNGWEDIAFGNGQFVAIASSGTGDRCMVSDDGVNWELKSTAVDNAWQGITFGDDRFVAVSDTGTGDRVMTLPLLGAATAILDLQSSTSGFLPPRMTERKRDEIPNPVGGLEIYNNELGRPEYYNNITQTWSGGASGSSKEVFVRSIADLPAPVAFVIILADDTFYQVLESFDTEGNQIQFGSGTLIVGLSGTTTIITGTTTVALLATDGSSAINTRNVGFVQSGAGDLLDLTTNALANSFFNDSNFTGILRLVSGSFAGFSRCLITGQIIQDGVGGGVGNLSISDNSAVQDSGVIDGLILFETGVFTSVFVMRDSAIFLLSASVGIRLESGVTVGDFEISNNLLGDFNAGAFGVVVQDPDDVNAGLLNELVFGNVGTKLACDPTSSSNFGAPNLQPTDVGFHSDGSLLIIDPTANLIYKMVGITSSVGSSIATPAANGNGVTWARGNLITCDPVTALIYVHAGFTTTITTSFATPATAIRGLAFDGTNLISTDITTGFIYIHEGISATIRDTIAPTSITSLHGIAYDGVNLIATDINDATVHVLDKGTGTTKYTFTAAVTPNGCVVTDTGFIYCYEIGADIYLYDHPVTFDHSSATWEMVSNSFLADSADRGGSVYADDTAAGIAVTVATGVWTDIAATGIAYGPFTEVEKCRLNDEANGTVKWTGVTDRGRTFAGQAFITRAGSAADRTYQLAVVINGTVQQDSITSQVLPDTSTFSTLQTLPITRDITKDDEVKMQIRNMTDTQSPLVITNKLSIH